MSITPLGVRSGADVQLQYGFLARSSARANAGEAPLPTRPLVTGLQFASGLGGGVLTVGGLGLWKLGHGRMGTGLAAVGAALLGASLLTGCTASGGAQRTPRPPRNPVPGDDGRPSQTLHTVADSVAALDEVDTTNPAPAGWQPQSGMRDSREGVVQIEHERGLGSGWVVQPGKVITNYHVAQGVSAITVIDHQGTSHSGTVVRLDSEHDLALLSVPGLNDTPLVMDDVVEAGEQVEITGYPAGFFGDDPGTASFFVDVLDDGRQRRTILFNGESAQGVSGGAMINGAGEVVGTAFSIGEFPADSGHPAEPFTLAIPNDQVRDFLDVAGERSA